MRECTWAHPYHPCLHTQVLGGCGLRCVHVGGLSWVRVHGRDCNTGTRVAEMHTDKLCPGREKANHVLMAWLHVPQTRSHREPRQTHGHVVKQGKTDTRHTQPPDTWTHRWGTWVLCRGNCAPSRR